MSDQERVVLTRQELEELCDKVVDNALIKLGIESQDHREMQEDMIFLRKLRAAHEAVTRKKMILSLGLIFTVTITLLALGIKAWIGGLMFGIKP